MSEPGPEVTHGSAEGFPDDPPIFKSIHDRFDAIERVLIYVVSALLIALAGVSVINTISLVWNPIFSTHDYTKAISLGFDAAFLTIILLEVLHTVLSRSSLVQQVQEFLVIGITSAVRHSLGVAAAVSDTHQVVTTLCSTSSVGTAQVKRVCQDTLIAVPNSTTQEVVIELAVNAGAVLLLVLALWLVRHSTASGERMR